MIPRLQEKYWKDINPALLKEFGYINRYQAPRLKKIVVSMGIGQGGSDAKILETAMKTISQVTGQKGVIRRAKKAIAGFKIRKGVPVGCKVTLRRQRMYEFLDRTINVVLPRVRDFRGLSSGSFDGGVNYSFGVEEQSVFPEVDRDKTDTVLGMNITIVTSAKSRDEARRLLEHLGMPFRKEEA